MTKLMLVQEEEINENEKADTDKSKHLVSSTNTSLGSCLEGFEDVC
jgi:hypothetical protein